LPGRQARRSGREAAPRGPGPRAARVSASSPSSSSGNGRSSSKRAIALRRTLYSPALVAFGCCVLKAVSFGFKPLGVLMTCSVLGFTVPFGPHTLWDTVPCCAIVGLLLYFTSRMELDWVAQAGILAGGLGTILFSWKLQGPVPSLPRRVPQYIQARLEQQYEREDFKEKTSSQFGKGRSEVSTRSKPRGAAR